MGSCRDYPAASNYLETVPKYRQIRMERFSIRVVAPLEGQGYWISTERVCGDCPEIAAMRAPVLLMVQI